MSRENSQHTGANQETVEEYLQRSEVHHAWESVYLSPETERFYELVFHWLRPWLRKGPILDAGCGTGVLTLRLAQYAEVKAVDLSEKALAATRERMKKTATVHPVTCEAQDLTSLTFGDGSFPVVFCWGVLMHVPQVEAALHELMRVTAPGGYLILGENHRRSWQSRLMRLRGKGTFSRVVETPAGREHWYQYPEGDLVARHADVRWIIAQARQHGFVLRKRHAAQFSELYATVRSPWLRRRFHALNRFWFRLGWAGPALGNLLVFEKNA
jgi:2-polyprenyl-3-methyl-5-hydroxy-6-metoxy-1,4-benzoquinol methylase